MDKGWEHGTQVGAHGSRCNYCLKVMKTGGVSRLKDHLAGSGKDVAKCKECPQHIRKELLELKEKNKKKAAHLREWKKRVLDELRHFGHEADVEISVSDDDEHEEARDHREARRHDEQTQQVSDGSRPQRGIRALLKRSQSSKGHASSSSVQQGLPTSFNPGLKEMFKKAVSKFFIYNHVPAHVASVT